MRDAGKSQSQTSEKMQLKLEMKCMTIEIRNEVYDH
jgi:hypothetical protein